jgi:RNA polymerase sigma-70 factor (ECF subfamily)
VAGCEDDLLLRAREGDPDALTDLLRAHGAGVRRRIGAAINLRWRRHIDLDDLMQVTYLEAFLSIRRFVPGREGGFGAWLLQIARNNLLDAVRELRKAKRPDPEKQVELAGDDSYVGLMDRLASTSATPSRSAVRHEQVAAMQAAIAQLPETYRLVVERFDIEFRPAVDVARDIGRSPGAVYMIRARAHDRLREILSRAPASPAV